jgi:GT2 family glycosyltransferase
MTASPHSRQHSRPHSRQHSRPHSRPRLSASIVTWNNANQVARLLESLQNQLDLSNITVYVIDNASSDNTVKLIQTNFPWVKLLINPSNLGFGAAHNKVLPLLNSDYHAIINPDIVLCEDSLGILSNFLEQNSQAVLAVPRVLNINGSEQHLPKLKPAFKYLLARRLIAISSRARALNTQYTRSDEDLAQPTVIANASGSFMVIRTSIFKQLSGFDERFFLYFEDNDLSLRAAKLGELYFCPQTAVVHGYAQSWTHNLLAFKRLIVSMFRFFGKHGW